MKIIVTKCLVLSALAIGMSSNVMAEELVVKSSHAHKLTPIAFEVNEGEQKATALLLLGKKGDINGLICYTSAQTNLGDNCYRVTGKISQYGGSNHIELLGNEIKHSKINKTTALIDIPSEVAQTGAPTMYTINTAVAQEAIGGEATSLYAQYKNNQFITSYGFVNYQQPTQVIESDGRPPIVLNPITQ